MAFSLTEAIIGGGGVVAGWIGSIIQHYYSAEGRFNKRVDDRLVALEQGMEECRRRDGHIGVLVLSLKLALPELFRLEPTSPVLQQVIHACRALPPDDTDLLGLITQLGELQ